VKLNTQVIDDFLMQQLLFWQQLTNVMAEMKAISKELASK
jgi:hypothetical protein